MLEREILYFCFFVQQKMVYFVIVKQRYSRAFILQVLHWLHVYNRIRTTWCKNDCTFCTRFLVLWISWQLWSTNSQIIMDRDRPKIVLCLYNGIHYVTAFLFVIFFNYEKFSLQFSHWFYIWMKHDHNILLLRVRISIRLLPSLKILQLFNVTINIETEAPWKDVFAWMWQKHRGRMFLFEC